MKADESSDFENEAAVPLRKDVNYIRKSGMLQHIARLLSDGVAAERKGTAIQQQNAALDGRSAFVSLLQSVQTHHGGKATELRAFVRK